MSYTVPNAFAGQSGNVPASQLDTNFTTLAAAINNAFLVGTLSSRPAADGTGNGRYYFATDANGGTLYRDNGTSWVQVSPGVTQTIVGPSVTSGLKVQPLDPGNITGSQGSTTGGTPPTFTAVGSGYYNLFNGSANQGFLLSSPFQFFGFNAVISAKANPTVAYYYWNGSAWTSFVPAGTANFNALGYTQARWASGSVGGWAVGGSGTGVPAGNFNILVVQSTAVTVTGRCSLVNAFDVTADTVIATDGSGFTYRTTAFSQYINCGQVGANGIDTGSLGATSYYYVYLIYNPTGMTWSALVSASATAPTMPVNYTAKVLAGGYLTNASSNLLPWYQLANKIFYPTPIADLATASNTATPWSLTVPPQAIGAKLALNNGNQALYVSPEPFTNGIANVMMAFNAGNTLGPLEMPIRIPQTLYYAVTSGGGTTIYTVGYTMPGNSL